MMRFAIYFLIQLVALSATAQRDFSYFQQFDNTIKSLYPIEDGFLVINANDKYAGLWNKQTVELIRMDTSGKIVWRILLPAQFSEREVSEVINMQIVRDSIFVFGKGRDCEGSGNIKNVLTLLDEKGNILDYSEQKFPQSKIEEFGPVGYINNNYISLFGDFSDKWLGTNHETVKDSIIRLGSLYPMVNYVINNESKRILFLFNFFDIVEVLNENLQKITSLKSFGNYKRKYIGVFGEGFYIYYESQISSFYNFVAFYDKNLEEIPNLRIENISYDNYNSNFRTDSLRNYVIPNDYQPLINSCYPYQPIFCNTSLVPEQWTKIYDIKTKNGKTYILGNTVYNHLFLHKYELSELFQPIKTGIDIELSNLETTMKVVPNPKSWNPTAKDLTLKNVRVRVSNKGKQPLKGFEIKTRFRQCAGYCLEAYNYNKIFNNTLLPNQTITVDLDSLNFNCYESDNPNICYSVMPLDAVGEDDFNNNIACVSLKTTAFNEVIFLDASISPNPTDGLLYIQSDSSIDYLEVLNITGNKILSKNNLQFPYQLECSSLPSGCYLLCIKGEGKVQYKRFILQK